MSIPPRQIPRIDAPPEPCHRRWERAVVPELERMRREYPEAFAAPPVPPASSPADETSPGKPRPPG